jgi:hypothetical protein
MLGRLKELLFCLRERAELRAEVVALKETILAERQATARERSKMMLLLRAMRDVNADLDTKLLEAGCYGEDRRMD